MLYPDQSIQGRTERLALDQGTNVDQSAVWPHWFNHTVQPGLDASELKTCFSVIRVFTHAQKRFFCGTKL